VLVVDQRVNFNTSNLQAMNISEPPLTMIFTNHEMNKAIKSANVLGFREFPINTRAVNLQLKLHPN